MMMMLHHMMLHYYSLDDQLLCIVVVSATCFSLSRSLSTLYVCILLCMLYYIICYVYYVLYNVYTCTSSSSREREKQVVLTSTIHCIDHLVTQHRVASLTNKTLCQLTNLCLYVIVIDQ